MLASAPLVLVVVLTTGGPWVVADDGVHSLMCTDSGGGRCRSNVVVAGCPLLIERGGRGLAVVN